jgi:hypothetical protein
MKFLIKHKYIAIAIVFIFSVLQTILIVEVKKSGYEAGKLEIQTQYDKYKTAVLKAESDARKEALDETSRLNTEWQKKLDEQYEKQKNLESVITNIRNNNNRLSEQIRAFSSRTKSKNDSASAANIESQTCWTLFENRRRIDSDRIKDAERINDELILAKKYIETIRENDAEE